jgi:plastocyanin
MVEISAGLVIIGFAIALAVFGFVYVNQDSGESFFGERDKVLLGNGSFADKDLNDGDFDGETIYLDIEDFDFSLNVLTINQGDKVVWENLDSVKHTVTSDNGDFDSGLLSKGETFSHVFNDKGSFDYDCSPHPNMRAKIIVE